MKKKTVKGRLVQVPNTNRRFGSATAYFCLWIEDIKGKNERCIMLTESELAIAEARAEKNKEDIPKKSFFNDLLD